MSSGFGLLTGAGKRLEVRREMEKHHRIYSPSLFLLGLMFKDGYVAIPMPMLCSCVTAPLAILILSLVPSELGW